MTELNAWLCTLSYSTISYKDSVGGLRSFGDGLGWFRMVICSLNFKFCDGLYALTHEIVYLVCTESLCTWHFKKFERMTPVYVFWTVMCEILWDCKNMIRVCIYSKKKNLSEICTRHKRSRHYCSGPFQRLNLLIKTGCDFNRLTLLTT